MHSWNILRLLRIALSLLVGATLTLTLLGVAHLFLPLHLQLLPALMAGAVGTVALWALVTLLTGRLYCSVVCPMGLWQDLVGHFSRLRVRPRGRRWQWVVRGVVLAAVAVSALWGVGRLWVYLDPYSAFSRIVTQAVHLGWTGGDLFLSDRSGMVSGLNRPLLVVVALTVIVFTGCAWIGGRLYCNWICPVGTLLGLLSRCSWLRVRIDADRCVGCGRCARECKGGCIDLSGPTPRVYADACVDCFDCLGVCPSGAIRYGRNKKDKAAAKAEAAASAEGATEVSSETPTEAPGDISRRRFLATTATAVAAVPLLRAQRVLFETTQGERWEKKIRTTMPDGRPAAERFWAIMPPATVSRDRFLARCTACQACVAQCPEHVLKPALREYGIEGFMAPTVSYENGRCRPDCNRCAEVCPTGAIRLLPLAQKRQDKMGWANFNSRTCITQTDGVECGLCARRCPHKAITLVEKDGRKVPRVQVARCTGCGACEYYCPARPKAIYVEGLMF
jgi:ferredoxin